MWKASSQVPDGEIDAVYGAFGGSEAPFQGEPGGHGVESRCRWRAKPVRPVSRPAGHLTPRRGREWGVRWDSAQGDDVGASHDTGGGGAFGEQFAVGSSVTPVQPAAHRSPGWVVQGSRRLGRGSLSRRVFCRCADRAWRSTVLSPSPVAGDSPWGATLREEFVDQCASGLLALDPAANSPAASRHPVSVTAAGNDTALSVKARVHEAPRRRACCQGKSGHSSAKPCETGCHTPWSSRTLSRSASTAVSIS